jgi:hypothetical protein
MAKNNAKSIIDVEGLIQVLEAERTQFVNVWDQSGKCFGQGTEGHFSVRYANGEVSVLLTDMSDVTCNGYVPNEVVNHDDVIAVLEILLTEQSLRGPSKAAQALAPKGSALADEA